MFHPEGIQTGEYWQKNGVAFKRIKLTNKKTAKEGSNNVSKHSAFSVFDQPSIILQNLNL